MNVDVLVIGSGIAGGTCATTLAQRSPSITVTMVDGEALGVPDRTALSKTYLTAGDSLVPFAIAPEVLANFGVRSLSGSNAALIDANERTCTLADGDVIEWDRLVLATGSEPRRLNVEGIHHAGVSYLREVRDASRLRARLWAANRLVVVGAGLIGLEVAASARSMGLHVTVVNDGPNALSRVLPPALASHVIDRHRAAGVEFRFNDAVRAIEGDSDARCVELGSGERLETDAVLISIGAVPRDGLAKRAGLATNDGVLVDDSMASTSHAAVFAIGDVARVESRQRSSRSESWTSAIRQGEVAAGAILGQITPFDDTPWFWSDQYENTLQSAGTWGDSDEIVETEPCGAVPAAVYGLRGGTLVAAAAFGQNPTVGQLISIATRLISASCNVPTEALAGGSPALRAHLRSVAAARGSKPSTGSVVQTGETEREHQ